MNTPAHAVVNLLLLGDRDRASFFAPVASGAILPDLPMVLFYFVEKVWLGTPEAVIWSESYYEIGWQALFDAFNSLPLLALAMLLSWALTSTKAVLLFASMAVHAACDLVLHHDDAHRHFFPFSDWRFASPVSYWDPRHHGEIVSMIEVAAVILGAAWLFKQYPATGHRGFLGFIVASYAFYIAYVVVVWM